MNEPLDLGAPAPIGWRRLRLKDVATYVNRGVAPTYCDGESDVIAFNQKCVRPDLSIAPELGRPIEPGTVTDDSPARLGVGDVVINCTGRGTLGRAAVVRAQPPVSLVADGHVTIVRPVRESLDPSFLGYLLGTEAFYEQANACLAVGATSQTELNRDALRRLRLALPLLKEQRRISDLLDAETERVNELIGEQSRQVTLLEERTSAAIEAAMATGTSHRLKHLLAAPLAYGAAEPGDSTNPSWPRYIRTTDVTPDGRLRADTFRSLAPEVARPFLLRDGDLLLTRSGATVGKSFLYRDEDGPACFAGYLIRVRPNVRRVLPGYLMHYTRTKHYWDQVREASVQATIENVSAARYAEFEVPLLPLSDQASVVRRIDAALERTRRLQAEMTRQIALLQEHRQALITHAVTHGIDGLSGVA